MPQAEDAHPLTTDSLREIVKLITTAVLADSSVQLRLDEGAIEYFSLFRVTVDNLEELEAGDYLPIAPLDPPIGNVKIRQAERVHLHFFTSDYSAQATTTLQQITTDKSIRLQMPKQLELISQRRNAVRVKIDEKWPVQLKVIRPSGVSFLAVPEDLSAGGVCFKSVGSIPTLSEKARVQLVLNWRDEKIKLKVKGVMLKDLNRQGEVCLRAQFLPDSYQGMQEIEQLVALLQRKHLLMRRELFEDAGGKEGETT
uniref:PilZ domain-containing protein n=1 Tax=Magnetococcus massalia (strain MO-1) TaxID=451514 RepID=A0A1S7LMY6_MAGMO|nr:Conserved protein of unknown function. Type IV pilus assembly PilZ [Candidatus Magnetococcus massalia]